MRERARIAQFFAPLAAEEPGSFNLRDDAAALTPPSGQQFVITTDSVIQSIHVLANATPQQYARKLVRRNLSDLAAMGATPWRYTLNLHTPPSLSDDWFSAFAATLATEQKTFDMVLIGGDTTSGGDAIHTTMTCFGLTPGPLLRRNGATLGDDIYVSGTIGDAALGLKLLQHNLQQNISAPDTLIARYHTPEPRLALGIALRNIASSAIDISDGLLSDIAQLCAASQTGATIVRDKIPHSLTMQHMQTHATLWNIILHGGDDYEICFTAAPDQHARIAALATSLSLPLTRIGSITHGHEMQLYDAAGERLQISSEGWEHG